MCKVADAAMTMVNQSIDLVNQTGDSRYYTDFYKLHKLLYYAQGYMLVHYKKRLFDEDICAHKCGPFIKELLDLDISYDTIQQRFCAEDVYPLTSDRMDAIAHTLRRFGTMSKDELVNRTKREWLYQKYGDESDVDAKRVIPCDDMAKATDIFDPYNAA